jgi:uncharacterized coiled-coil protein SlyX
MQYKRITLFAGHYGSGKTNIAVNYALHLKSLGEAVVVADLDIVNPYFRTRDSQADFEKAGIRLISSEFASSNVDLPALRQDVYSILDNPTECAIMDIGGDDRGAYALGRYADAIKAEGMPGADKIFQLEAKIAFIDNQIKEINEAISCANTAKYTTEDILSKLESAEKWGTFDIWGGGTVAGIAKHCELDDAQERVEKLQIQLRKLKTELADVTIQTDIHVNVDGFLRFADYFYDGLLADCAVQDQIKQSQTQIISTQNKISDVINHLNTMLKNVESEKNLAKHQIKELVNKVEI